MSGYLFLNELLKHRHISFSLKIKSCRYIYKKFIPLYGKFVFLYLIYIF